ncbi:TPM domain-containing protein [uncultured Enterococcus sp.]|uniref:TPM domain-containing protein n=1 Tax=uncultured Enterococcus sp. TaxID=167972 RepID=UPI002AA88E7F|nr:TPM domain-containing protein [uncultured Enterococcus sp.]
MRKRYLVLAIAVFSFLLSFPLSVHASDNTVDDQAGLFTSDEIQQLNDKAASIEKKSKAEIFIVTTDDSNKDPYKFADYYLLDTIGKDKNGIIFYIDMNNREFVISRSGNMIDYLNDARTESALDDIEYFMNDQDYFGAADSYLVSVNTFFDKGVPKGHYRVDSETGEITYYKSLTPVEIILAIVGAGVIAGGFVLLSISKYKLKFGGGYNYPVKEKSSLQLTEKEDRFINSFVTTRHIPRNNSGGGGGSGSGGGGSTTHTTGGGTFSSSGRSF